jgi:hypothetical protein
VNEQIDWDIPFIIRDQSIISMRSLVALFAALLAAPVHAAEEDLQLWGFITAIVPVDEGVTATFELSPRLREGTEQLQSRAGLDFAVTPLVDLGGGVIWVEFDRGHEFRTYQQAELTLGRVQFRTRIEERFLAGAERAQLRLRPRVQYTLPLAQGLRSAASVEYLHVVRSEVPGQPAPTDSWRFNLSAAYRISPHIELGAGYLAIFRPHPTAPDRLSHVQQLRLTVR